MNPLKRHEKIMEALLEHQEVTVSDLSELLQVTWENGARGSRQVGEYGTARACSWWGYAGSE